MANKSNYEPTILAFQLDSRKDIRRGGSSPARRNHVDGPRIGGHEVCRELVRQCAAREFDEHDYTEQGPDVCSVDEVYSENTSVGAELGDGGLLRVVAAHVGIDHKLEHSV